VCHTHVVCVIHMWQCVGQCVSYTWGSVCHTHGAVCGAVCVIHMGQCVSYTCSCVWGSVCHTHVVCIMGQCVSYTCSVCMGQCVSYTCSCVWGSVCHTHVVCIWGSVCHTHVVCVWGSVCHTHVVCVIHIYMCESACVYIQLHVYTKQTDTYMEFKKRQTRKSKTDTNMGYVCS